MRRVIRNVEQRLEQKETVVRGLQAAEAVAAESTAAEKRGLGRPRRVIFAHNTQPRDILYPSERADRGPAVQIPLGMSVTGVTTPPLAMATGALAVFVGESGTVRVPMGYPPGMDTAAGRSLQEAADL